MLGTTSKELGLRAAGRLSAVLPRGPRKRVSRYVRDELALPGADVVFVSFAKSGRTWVRVMLSRLYQLRYGLPETALLEFDNLHQLEPRVPRILFTHDGDSMKRPHQLDPDKSRYGRCPTRGDGGDSRSDARPGRKVVLLARHPVDVAVSRHFHLRHRAVEARRKAQGRQSLAGFLWDPLGSVATIVAFLNDWARARAELPQLLVVRYEDFRSAPERTLGGLAEFLEIGSSEDEIADAVAFGSLENLRRREADDFFGNERLGARTKGDEDSYKVRKGKVGGYRDYLSPDEAERIEAFVRAQLDRSFGYSQPAPGSIS